MDVVPLLEMGWSGTGFCGVGLLRVRDETELSLIGNNWDKRGKVFKMVEPGLWVKVDRKGSGGELLRWKWKDELV